MRNGWIIKPIGSPLKSELRLLLSTTDEYQKQLLYSHVDRCDN